MAPHSTEAEWITRRCLCGNTV